MLLKICLLSEDTFLETAVQQTTFMADLRLRKKDNALRLFHYYEKPEVVHVFFKTVLLVIYFNIYLNFSSASIIFLYIFSVRLISNNS